MRVGPLAAHRNDMESYLRSFLSTETDGPANPVVAPQAAVMIWNITFIDSPKKSCLLQCFYVKKYAISSQKI